MHKLWGVFSSRHSRTAKGATAICISSEKREGRKGTELRQKKKSTCVPLVLAVVWLIHAECLLWEGRESQWRYCCV